MCSKHLHYQLQGVSSRHSCLNDERYENCGEGNWRRYTYTKKKFASLNTNYHKYLTSNYTSLELYHFQASYKTIRIALHAKIRRPATMAVIRNHNRPFLYWAVIIKCHRRPHNSPQPMCVPSTVYPYRIQSIPSLAYPHRNR